MSKQHTIELNGKRYDARTGKVLASPERITAKPVHKHTGTAIDGVRKPGHHAAHSKTPATATHHKLERSKTLMRHAVKKPASVTKTQPKPAHPAPLHHAKPMHAAVDPHRVSRAHKVPKSQLITRFGSPVSSVKTSASVLPVQPEPEHDYAPEPLLNHHQEAFAGGKKHSFEKAIQNATSHTQPHHKKTTRRQHLSHKLRVSPRIVNVAAGSLATVLLVGFVAYQNVPNLTMRLATTRSGVAGSLPGYQPAGFGMDGPIKYQPGQITINFKSHSDNRAFTINQRSSAWNSEALQENFLAAKRRTYQTFQDSGKTIYIYDDNNATWVDGGIWYQIEGNSSLNSDQLLRIASSM